MHKNFTHKVKVYYEDTDAGGVVYYGKYLNFLERARTEAITNIGLSNKKLKKILVPQLSLSHVILNIKNQHIYKMS